MTHTPDKGEDVVDFCLFFNAQTGLMSLVDAEVDRSSAVIHGTSNWNSSAVPTDDISRTNEMNS